jgi:hypothetical protein
MIYFFFYTLSSFEGINLNYIQSGGDSEKVTPVPIPNTEVKLLSVDGSWRIPPVRVERRQAKKEQPNEVVLFVFIYGLGKNYCLLFETKFFSPNLVQSF